VLKIFCPALTSPCAHAGLPIKMQHNMETTRKTARAQPLRDPLTPFALDSSVFGFLELRCLMFGFTWLAMGASYRFNKRYLPAADFAT
jgi:hypothetical protein